MIVIIFCSITRFMVCMNFLLTKTFLLNKYVWGLIQIFQLSINSEQKLGMHHLYLQIRFSWKWVGYVAMLYWCCKIFAKKFCLDMLLGVVWWAWYHGSVDLPTCNRWVVKYTHSNILLKNLLKVEIFIWILSLKISKCKCEW